MRMSTGAVRGAWQAPSCAPKHASPDWRLDLSATQGSNGPDSLITNVDTVHHLRKTLQSASSQVDLEAIRCLVSPDADPHHIAAGLQTLLQLRLCRTRLVDRYRHQPNICSRRSKEKVDTEPIENCGKRIGIRQSCAVAAALVAAREKQADTLSRLVDDQRTTVSAVAERA